MAQVSQNERPSVPNSEHRFGLTSYRHTSRPFPQTVCRRIDEQVICLGCLTEALMGVYSRKHHEACELRVPPHAGLRRSRGAAARARRRREGTRRRAEPHPADELPARPAGAPRGDRRHRGAPVRARRGRTSSPSAPLRARRTSSTTISFVSTCRSSQTRCSWLRIRRSGTGGRYAAAWRTPTPPPSSPRSPSLSRQRSSLGRPTARAASRRISSSTGLSRRRSSPGSCLPKCAFQSSANALRDPRVRANARQLRCRRGRGGARDRRGAVDQGCLHRRLRRVPPAHSSRRGRGASRRRGAETRARGRSGSPRCGKRRDVQRSPRVGVVPAAPRPRLRRASPPRRGRASAGGDGVSVHDIALEVNGEPVEATVESRRLLLDFLREDLGSGRRTRGLRARRVRDVHRARSTGEASARASRSPCRPTAPRSPPSRDWPRMRAGSAAAGVLGAAGSAVRVLHAGDAASRDARFSAEPRPDDEQVREGIASNLCRCTGYQFIIEAVMDAAARLQATPVDETEDL